MYYRQLEFQSSLQAFTTQRAGTLAVLPPLPLADWSREALVTWTEKPRLLPDRPYTKDQLLAYLDHGRKKCQATIEALTDEAAQRLCRYEWMELSFAELLLYNMRHVQEHGAQLNMLLGQKVGPVGDWVSQVRPGAT